MAILGSLAIQGGSGQVATNQPVSVTLTLTNTGASVVTVSSLAPFVTSNSQPYASASLGTPTNVGNVATIQPNGGTLVYSFGAVFWAPQGSAETGLGQSSASTTATLLGVTVYTSDGSVTSVSETITPAQGGATAPAAAGQFVFSSAFNSPNYLFW